MAMRKLIVATVLALGACHGDPKPIHPQPGDLPPLPPASGTPVGYLIDSADQLKLRDDQLKKLKEIDASLAARDASLDTQLRQIERPPEEDEAPPKPGEKRPHHNNAPGASMPTSADANKLHDIRNANDREALKQAFAVLDGDQQSTAKHILQDRGIDVGSGKKAPDPTTEDGTPLPGGEP
jgi:hypothetical protein